VIYFCLPVFNEEQTIGLTIFKIKEVMEDIRSDFKIIALDDDSTDGTWQTVQTYEKLLPLTTVRNTENMGLGYCLGRFVQIVTDDSRYPESDIMITLESDFTSDANCIPSLVRAIEEGSDVVIASGFTKAGEVVDAPFKVKFTTVLLHLLLRNLYAIDGVRDYLSILRAYRVAVLRRLQAKYENDMLNFKTRAANTELLVRLSGLSRQITEVPCRQRYDIRKRKTRMRTAEMVKNHILLISQHWGNRED
jgi:glycosyltransferase involved in cell wall biosynthesis